MKKFLLSFVVFAFAATVSAKNLLSEKLSTGIHFTVDETGRITELSCDGENRIHPDEPSWLVSIQQYEKAGKEFRRQSKTLTPKRMTALRALENGRVWRLAYDHDAVVELKVENKGRYLRFEVLKASSPAGISMLKWGPYVTTLHDTVGKYLGVVRSKDCAMGCLSLDPGTDGTSQDAMSDAACFRPVGRPGGMLTLSTIDHSRPVRYNHNQFVSVPPAEGGGLTGAAIALWGVAKPTKMRELDLIEEIVRAERLPCPTIDGVWSKKSPRANESAFWVNYDDRTIDAWIKTAEVTGIRLLSRYNCFANWGHFEPDLTAFREGWRSLRNCSEKAKTHGIRTTAYTLSTFTRAFKQPEPFIAPVLDTRFNTYVDSETKLARPLPGPEGVKRRDKFEYVFWADPKLPPGVADNEIRLVKNPKTCSLFALNAEIVCEKVKAMNHRPAPRRFLNIGGELVVYRTAATNATELILGDCERGFYGSPVKAHPAGTSVVRMDGYDHYDSLMPGTDTMIREIARNIAAAARKGGLGNVILDGVERADRSGNDIYSVNHFVKTIFDHLPAEGTTFVGSRMSHYTWHLFTTQSWGEHDMKRGIRGSQFETRLQHQLNLLRSDFPNKLGQYYPDSCTMEDLDWIMSFAAAYDAGVDFQFGLPRTYEKCERIRLWEDARRAGAFSEREKLLMRQSDTQWELIKEDGRFRLSYAGRWQGKNFELEPASSAPVQVLAGGMVKPCSIDRTWVHSAGQAERWCITDDLVLGISKKESVATIAAPFMNHRWGSKVPLLVLRVPTDAKPLIRPVVQFSIGKSKISLLRLKETFMPGEYLTIPHRVSQAFVYDSRHELQRVVNLELIPTASFAKGDLLRVSVTSENAEPTSAIFNFRFITSSID